MTTSTTIESFNLEELFALTKGDIIEVSGLLVGIDPDESVVAMVTEVDEKAVTLRFTYLGIWLATRTLKYGADGPKWEN